MYMFCPPTTSAFVGGMWTEVISVKLNIDWLIEWRLTQTLSLFHCVKNKFYIKKTNNLMVNITRIIFLTRLNSFQLNEKQRIPHCQNSSKVNRKTKNTTLSEKFKGQQKNKEYHTV